LRSAREAMKNEELVKQIDHDIKQHGQYVSYYVEDAKKRQAILDKPATEWSCKDLDGKEHALKDYRGRVVVLDFWYRGCGWCIRAMPQMKEIATHYADKPVTIFGMNTDRNEDDARFVIDKMGLNYGNLKATGVPEKYKVQGFPTLLIIDQEGVLRDIHVGYSADLKEKVIESIDRLLTKKQS
jgi:thiol-disulfide isomerase/thioredoxin